MKHLKTVLLLATFIIMQNAGAQIKKQTSTTKKNTAVKQTKPVVKETSSKTTVAAVAQKEPAKVQEVENKKVTETTSREEQVATKAVAKKQDNENTLYKAALGVKFMWGIALTGKYFIKENHALEAIVRYRGYSGLANEIGIMALYEYEKPINGVEGLNWLVGGGAYFSHYSLKNKFYSDYYDNYKSSNLGIVGVAGLEYKFNNTPIAISADWMPAFDFNGGGFGAESGGFGIKYTF